MVDAPVVARGHDIVGVQAWRLAEDAGSGVQQHQRSAHPLERVTGAVAERVLRIPVDDVERDARAEERRPTH